MVMTVDYTLVANGERMHPGEPTGVATLTSVMTQLDQEVTQGNQARFTTLATGLQPLDDVLNGGLRRGELLILGGAAGVGKTILALQIARNVVVEQPDAAVLYACYEHDPSHLLTRLLCLESAEQGAGEEALTLRTLTSLTANAGAQGGLLAKLRTLPRYAPAVAKMTQYSDRLLLVKAHGSSATLAQIEKWAKPMVNSTPHGLLVVDYVQKVAVPHKGAQHEAELSTEVVQGLKELALSTGLRIIAIAAADRAGLQSPRVRFTDLRGSSALQYEADIGLMLNNKYAIVSREHLVYNVMQAEAMRQWVVLSVEKNRAGRAAVDLEYQLDAAHFRLLRNGGYVRERLVDDKMTLA
jgi:replicative DNA helicase